MHYHREQEREQAFGFSCALASAPAAPLAGIKASIDRVIGAVYYRGAEALF
ncbi:MAG TPA: hypothetical protein VKK81_02900 [Candidatus Binatia bacterium]|nr:hypothetical protein [Candidatus Binatia bacterium]